MTGRGASGLAWRDSDIVLVAAMTLLGLIGLIAAWFGASGTADLDAQAMWLNVAVAGLMVSFVGYALWFMRGRQAIGERRTSLVALESPEPAAVPAAGRPSPVPRGETAPIRTVRVPGTRLVHDGGCPLVAAKEVEPAAPGSGKQCGVCRP